MSQEKFDLVFSGELVPGYELAQVKKNIQLLFRIDETKTDLLFSGRAIPLKKGLDAETANKYRVAIKKAGARVAVVQSEAAPTKLQSVPAEKPGVATAHAEAKEGGEGGFTTELGAQPASPRPPRKEIEAPGFAVADVGEDILPSEYRLPLATVEVDTSGLSVAPQAGNLVGEDEIMRPRSAPKDVPDFDIAPVGSDVLTPEERPQVRAVEVNIAGLSVAQTGERLAPPSKQAPPPPNVDHIKLKS